MNPVHHALTRYEPRFRDMPFGSLSPRELTAFRLLGRGRTTAEVAVAMGIQQKTLETFREHIKGKLGLNSAPQLVRFAVLFDLSERLGPDKELAAYLTEYTGMLT